MSAVRTISIDTLHELQKQKPRLVLLDLRTPAEFQDVKIPFSKSIPIQSLNPREAVKEAGADSSDTLYLICSGGFRSRVASDRFLGKGIDNVCIVEGGVQAWETAGYPVIRGRKAISIERQVRITAGSLILLGLSLGFAVHAGFFGLSAFVGCGLVFAGITDTCGLALLLARMPWNQRKDETPNACSLQGRHEGTRRDPRLCESRHEDGSSVLGPRNR